MRTSEGSFDGAGGVRIAWRAWAPEHPPRTCVLLSHDLAGHGGRHAAVVEALVAAGHAVLAPDHLGHGRSGGERALIDNIAAAVSDLASAAGRLRAEHPGVPLIALGQGMGAALAISLALREPPDGLVLIGPMLAAPTTSPVDATALSRDPAVVAAFEGDPLVHHGEIPSATVEALGAEIATFDARAPGLRLPVLLMHGSNDRLADPEATRAFHRHLGSGEKVLVLWEGLFHEIFAEPPEDREEPLERLASWLEDRAGGR